MSTKDAAARRQLAELALKSFFKLAQDWKLNRSEAMTLLGITATSTYANWKNSKTSTLPRDTLERISYLLSISDKVTKEFQEEPEKMMEWMRGASLPLPSEDRSSSPMHFMMQGNVSNLFQVQSYLQQMDSITINNESIRRA